MEHSPKVQYTSVAGTLTWAKLDPNNPGTDFNDNPQWEVTVIVPKSTAEKWQTKGLTKTVKQNKEGDYVLRLSMPVTSKSGKPMKAPVVKHVEGYLVEPDIIGNGSKGTCRVAVIPYDNKFGKGYTTRLHTVTIEDLVEYTAAEPEEDDFEF